MLLLITLFVPILIFWYVKRKEKYEKFWKHIMEIPGPKGIPLLGTYYRMLNGEQVFAQNRALAKEYYPIFKKYNMSSGYVALLHPEDIELVLNNPIHMEKGLFYSFISEWLGHGILTSGGKVWHKKRKNLTPAFHFSILQEFLDVFNNETNHLVNYLKTVCHQPHVDIIEPIKDFALYAIGETSFGTNLRGESKCTEYKQAVDDFGKLFTYRITRPWLYISSIYKLTSAGRKHYKTIDTLHKFSNNIIRNRKQHFEQNGGKVNDSGKKELALLDLILQAKYKGANIDDTGIREDVDTFIFGGHDTTGVSICYTLMALANETTVQENIYEEIISITENVNPSFSDLRKLEYMERCIKESLRLYPSAPVLMRIAGEEIKTKTGYTIPKGCNVFLYVYDMHRYPENFEDPDRFDPDRFLPENTAKRHPFAYLPFSAGSRNCIGQKYAMLQMKAVLCGILRNFKLEPVTRPEDVKYAADIVLRPTCEIKVKFVPRN